MIRKYISVVFVILCIMSAFTVSAKKMVLFDELKPYGDFYILGEDDEKIAEILSISKEDLNSIEDSFIAVNKENTKQIRVSVNVTDFSGSIGNMSNLSNDKIIALSSRLSGFEDAKGEVVVKDGQKFLKVQLRSADSGGEYILTQYITVAAKQRFILSFYTDINEDTEYIEKTFDVFTSPHFKSETAENKNDGIRYVILIAAGLFFAVCIVIGISIVTDILKSKKQEEENE